jgi:hypothetical protein
MPIKIVMTITNHEFRSHSNGQYSVIANMQFSFIKINNEKGVPKRCITFGAGGRGKTHYSYEFRTDYLNLHLRSIAPSQASPVPYRISRSDQVLHSPWLLKSR